MNPGVVIPRGRCPKCGAVYYSWNLLFHPEENQCLYCSADLVVTQDYDPYIFPYPYPGIQGSHYPFSPEYLGRN